MQRAIRFIREWHGHKEGSVNSTLSLGVMDALVNYRRTAEWVADEHESEKPKSTRRSSKETV